MPSAGPHGRVSDSHPWLAAKRLLATRLLARFAPPGERLLDVGCGEGWPWPGFEAWGADIDPCAVEQASAKLGGRAVLCDAARLPFPDGSFAACLLLDVLEHLDDPLAALAEARRVLAPGGIVVAAVPLHPWMWSGHDEECGHKRRYRSGELGRQLSAAGFSVEYRTCWNMAGFLPLALARRLDFGAPGEASAAMRLAGPVLAAEARIAARVPLPVGVTEAAVGRAEQNNL
ncbi:MAG: class I SAM-dependent methyltransferase [Firmicutes bacterium]|nr:class I SAM-dependent methyltransferase [Bacillota bacterium]